MFVEALLPKFVVVLNVAVDPSIINPNPVGSVPFDEPSPPIPTVSFTIMNGFLLKVVFTTLKSCPDPA